MAERGQSLTERVASIAPVRVDGVYYRHAAPNRDAFVGGTEGRWGRAFPVIYLGRPTDSVVIEAYRHLIEAEGVPAKHVRPRVLYTVPISIDRILDLTVLKNLAAVGLTGDDLASDVDEYDACQRVAAAAHQLKWHGVLAPAAGGNGVTLALFRDRLALAEIPVPSERVTWEQLPPDPRKFRIVGDEDLPKLAGA